MRTRIPIARSSRMSFGVSILNWTAGGGTMWPWIAGIIAAIIVVTLVYGYTRKISATASTPLPPSSSTTTGSAR